MKKWLVFVILFAGFAIIPAISAHALLPQFPLRRTEDRLADISTQVDQIATAPQISKVVTLSLAAPGESQYHLYLPFVGMPKVPPAPPNTPRQNLLMTDNNINTILPFEDRIYFAGEFEYAGLYTGCGAPVDAATGEVRSGFPRVNKYIRAAVSDNHGGWYIGGQFTQVGALEQSYLAHILADGSVDTFWRPDVEIPFWESAIEVLALSPDGNTLYVSGGFTSIDDQPRNGIAALDAASGQVIEWDPNPDTYGSLYALVISPDNNTVYVGGYFDNIGGQPRNGLAALDAVSGQATDWDPKPGTYSTIYVLALSPDGNTVYVGGDFDEIGGLPRNNLAALDAANGQAIVWDPDVDDWVQMLAVSGDGHTIYIGGKFTMVGGQPRNHLAALNASNGQVTGWNPNPDTHSTIDALALSFDGYMVYVSGDFNTIGGQRRNYLVALDAASGQVVEWTNINGYAYTLALSRDGLKVYVGGSFTSIGGLHRHKLAALDMASGQITDWDPNPGSSYDGSVGALAVSPDRRTIYVGGYFTSIGGQPRESLAALDVDTGKTLDWTADLDANGFVEVLVMSADGNTLYVGGHFSSIGGQPRHNLAALDATSGQVTDWVPDVDNGVKTLALSPDGRTVYAGGTFKQIGGQSRNHIAALDAASGQVTDWDPNADAEVWALTMNPDGRTVYASGYFGLIGGQPRNHLAALDASTGQATNWDPNLGIDGYVYAQAVSPDGSAVYVGGTFNTIGGQVLHNLAVLDASEGFAAPWEHHLCSTYSCLDAIAVGDEAVYVGGFGFRGLWGSSLAIFDLPDLRITKTVTPTNVTAGQPITYTLTFSNAGLGTASQVLIQDSIPLTITVTDIFSHGVTYDFLRSPATYVWKVNELASGQGGSITIKGNVDSEATGFFSLTNQAEIRSRTIDANPLDNMAVVTHTVNAPLSNFTDLQRRPITLGVLMDSLSKSMERSRHWLSAAISGQFLAILDRNRTFCIH